MKDFIMPILALVGGLVSLFVDAKDRRKRWLFVVGLTLMALTTITLNFLESRAKHLELATVDQEKRELHAILLNITRNVQAVADKVGVLMPLGFTREKAAEASDAQIATAVSANSFYSESLGKLPNADRSDIRVEYFPKNVDKEKVLGAIGQSGMRVLQKKPLNDLDTNSIWIGNRITPDEAKFVAFALVRAGVGIAAIRRFRDGAGPKERLIQIGADPEFVQHPALTPEQIAAQTAY